MAELHVVTALISKYRELSGKLAASEKECERLKADLSHIHATIRVFNADFDPGTIKPRRPYRRNPLFKRGNLVRTALDILRSADEPLTTRELTTRILEYHGIPPSNDHELEQLRKGLHSCLMQRAKNGDILVDGSYRKRWAIAHNSSITK